MHKKIHPYVNILMCFVGAVLLAVIVFIVSLRPVGSREITALENIDGVKFPEDNGAQIISEQHAHADLYLNQPVLAKELELEITFNPKDQDYLAVAVRESGFWLSYSPEVFYENSGRSEENEISNKVVTKTVTIPLTDKVQDKDQSLDLMFFAESLEVANIESWISDRINDNTHWELHNINAEIKTKWPTGVTGNLQLADWLLSIIRRERAL